MLNEHQKQKLKSINATLEREATGWFIRDSDGTPCSPEDTPELAYIIASWEIGGEGW